MQEVQTRMFDGFFHLDNSAADPIADLELRLESAGVRRVLVVEAWAGIEKKALDKLAKRTPATPTEVAVAYCYRDQNVRELESLLRQPAARALRAKSADLESHAPALALLEKTGQFLVCHGEAGIGRITRAVVAVAKLHPALRIYIPHLGWPRREKTDDPDWKPSVAQLSALPNIVFGVSALGNFSKTPFPHADLQPLAHFAIDAFGPNRLVAATDYPRVEATHYAKTYHLARSWIKERWPEWSDLTALRP